jgi:hypothetical protein
MTSPARQVTNPLLPSATGSCENLSLTCSTARTQPGPGERSGLKFLELIIILSGALLGVYAGRRLNRSSRTDLKRRRLWAALLLVACAVITLLVLPWLL